MQAVVETIWWAVLGGFGLLILVLISFAIVAIVNAMRD